jgi:hypothetical protein
MIYLSLSNIDVYALANIPDIEEEDFLFTGLTANFSGIWRLKLYLTCRYVTRITTKGNMSLTDKFPWLMF